MGGDGAANAGSSGHEREGERGRSDARVEPVSGSVDDAERPEADVPPGLWQFARKQLREAYFHAARASVRDLELNPRPARDDDRLAADPPDPEPGVRRVLSAIRDLATAARDEVDEVDEDDEDDEVDAAEDARAQKRVKRRRKKATRVSSVRARFDADAKAAARRARFSSMTAAENALANTSLRRPQRRTRRRSGDGRLRRTSSAPLRASAGRGGARRPSRRGTVT